MCNHTSMLVSQCSLRARNMGSRCAIRPGQIGVIILLSVLPAFAQDTRDVQEPKVPAVCTRLAAQFTSQGETPAETGVSAPDTERIQNAIDHCKQGMAVALSADGVHHAFLSGP